MKTTTYKQLTKNHVCLIYIATPFFEMVFKIKKVLTFPFYFCIKGVVVLCVLVDYQQIVTKAHKANNHQPFRRIHIMQKLPYHNQLHNQLQNQNQTLTTHIQPYNKHTVKLVKTIYDSKHVLTGFIKYPKICPFCDNQIRFKQKTLKLKIANKNYFLCLRCANKFVHDVLRSTAKLNKAVPLTFIPK